MQVPLQAKRGLERFYLHLKVDLSGQAQPGSLPQRTKAVLDLDRRTLHSHHCFHHDSLYYLHSKIYHQQRLIPSDLQTPTHRREFHSP